MPVYAVVIDCIIDGEGESFVHEVYSSFSSATESFQKVKESEAIPTSLEKEWFEFADDPTEYDCGSVGDYLYNHIRVTIQSLTLEE